MFGVFPTVQKLFELSVPISTFYTHPPCQPAFIKPGYYKSAPAPGNPYTWDSVSRSANSFPLVKALCRPKSGVEAPSHVSQSNEVAGYWRLSIGSLWTPFNYPNPHVHHGFNIVGHRYLYGPPSELSGYVAEGFPSCTQICHDRQTESNSLENEELNKTSNTVSTHSLIRIC